VFCTGGINLRWTATLALLGLAAAAPQTWAATVDGVRLWSGPESTRVVLDLSAPVAHRVFTLSGPDRIVIDVAGAELHDVRGLPEAKGYVTGMRSGHRPDGALRVVLDVNRSVHPKSFLLEPNDSYGHRLVIDLVAGSEAPVVKRAPASRPETARDIIVAIDAGHGGDDPGASGPKGAKEKDVVLAIARKLAAYVREQPGMQPVLIRDGDYFVPLRQRVERAREAHADLFVSIHADAHRDNKVRGATIYALSEKGASDEAARHLAARENASDLIGGVSLADKDQVLARVLLDLSQSAAISASVTVGSSLIERLGEVTPLRKTQVQQAPFLVLKSPDVPSLLVETAYISNPREEAALRDPSHQAKVAHALYLGVLDYFRANPPPSSYLAMNPAEAPRTSLRHVITRGETLSGIAARYQVSPAMLRQVNRLATDVIRIGQVLTIPPI
jgi:N-acetylmuramoyl-L-alanine amidase